MNEPAEDCSMFDHRIEDRQELAHTGDQCHFREFPSPAQPLIEDLQTGFHLTATNVLMYSAPRTTARPPQVVRRPRKVPLSRFKGATPTNAAIWWRVKLLSSGSSAISVRLRTAHARQTLEQVVPLAPNRRRLDVLAQLLIQRRH